ncbi:MAG TPA: hypothetical protein VGC76_10290 [Pyrinomonadaceae bacterium]
MEDNEILTQRAVNPGIQDFLDIAIIDLKQKSKNLTIAGMLVFVVTLIVAIGLFYDIKHNTIIQLKDLNEAATPQVTLIYLIVRSAALGTVATTMLVFLAKTALACFDQSTRFAKRRYGALFLQFIYQKHDQINLQEKVTISEIMKFFDAWNQNVESAFTTVKVGKKGVDPMKMSINKDGATVELGNDK